MRPARCGHALLGGADEASSARRERARLTDHRTAGELRIRAWLAARSRGSLRRGAGRPHENGGRNPRGSDDTRSRRGRLGAGYFSSSFLNLPWPADFRLSSLPRTTASASLYLPLTTAISASHASLSASHRVARNSATKTGRFFSSTP